VPTRPAFFVRAADVVVHGSDVEARASGVVARASDVRTHAFDVGIHASDVCDRASDVCDHASVIGEGEIRIDYRSATICECASELFVHAARPRSRAAREPIACQRTVPVSTKSESLAQRVDVANARSLKSGNSEEGPEGAAASAECALAADCISTG
jgi:hypothetical protein